MDIAGEIAGALGLNGNGEVDRLEIHSWGEIARSGKASDDDIFKAFINPDEFTVNYNVLVESTTPPGQTGTPATHIGIQPLEITLKFYLDGTGAIGKPCNVADEVKKFYRIAGFDGNTHRIRYLRLIWGNLTLLRSTQYAFDCILKSASLQYKLFDTHGTPKRVIINATFTEALSNEIRTTEDKTSSPDLTHVRTVKEGDTLAGMAYAIYGDPGYYLKVAEVNKITNFRDLEPGMKIYFPPLDRTVNKK